MPSSVGDILKAVLEDKGYDVVCKEWEVVTNWDRIAGDPIAGVTECGRVDEGVLYVKVMSAPWRNELVYFKDMLKESILRETGCDTIKDIVFY
jgi:predicted nucleic acid-binding Zn ribbon protein